MFVFIFSTLQVALVVSGTMMIPTLVAGARGLQDYFDINIIHGGSSNTNSNNSTGLVDKLEGQQQVVQEAAPDQLESSESETSSYHHHCSIEAHKFEPLSHKGGTKFRVGVDAIRGYEDAIKEYSMVFGDYLTKTAGKRFDPPLEFEMVPMTSFQVFIDAADAGELDFFFSNSGIYSCLGVEVDASALATAIARLNVRGHVYELDVSAGVMIARKDRKDIQTVLDFKDKIIGAGALSTMLAGQVQFNSMKEAGLSYVRDPKQVVFTNNLFDVVKGVINGSYDVGFVRTDQIERGKDEYGNPLDTDLFNVINPKIYVMDDGNIFPFMHSTEMYPEFAFGVLPHINKDISEEVQQALFSLRHYADAAEGLETCYNTDGMTQADCDALPFPDSFASVEKCETTKDLAWTALNASRAASVAGFRTARSYASVRTMHEAGGFVTKNEYGDWTCSRASTFYESISCPEFYIKVDKEMFAGHCDKIGLPCKEGYDCFCNPCRLEVEVYPLLQNEGITNHCSVDEMCATMEQNKAVTFYARDNARRERINVRAVMIKDDAPKEVPVTLVEGTDAYEFQIVYPHTGVASIRVYVNDELIPTSPFEVGIMQRNCDGDYKGQSRKPTDDGTCICGGGDLEVSGTCVHSTIIFSIIVSIVIVLVVAVAFCYMRHRREQSDQMWHVKAEELHFNEPLDVIGRGSFGEVILAEYRGTKVAIKRVIRSDKKSPTTHGGSNKLNKSAGAIDKCDTPGSSEEDGNASSDGIDDKMQSSPSKKPVISGSRDSAVGSLDIDIEEGGGIGDAIVDLDLLAGLSFGGRRSKWMKICPGGKKEEDNHRVKSGILGSSTGGYTSKSFAAQLFTCLDKQHQRKQEFIMEMRLLSRLRHPCITTVMGAVISPFHDPMLVMEFMEYGSLHDLLQNDTMHTGGDIIMQIMRDIAQGLRYLHSSKPPICHGDLKARNILIDSRFRAKVADFGLSEKTKNSLTGTPYFMAPEYLRGRSYNPTCDIYSVGMILYEIYARTDPYIGEPLMKVLREVCDPSINRRPKIPENMPKKMVDIMKKCWSADPFYRPHAKDLDMVLMDMNTQEAEPETRDQKMLKKDRRPSADMLYEVFPRHIADALKAGRKVEPEHHELVTIFFSDVVGFTSISQTMSPLKVSEMLERLYESFDKLARAHKVFKVETIGDAYVGVTNLDDAQNDEHAKNIAEFAIDAVEAAGKIMIDEDNPAKGCIKIRVGLHSGSVVSNVIGSLNPRYGLFGDAVNTASRMESNSRKGRILCSEFSAQLLEEQAPHLLVKKRGKVDVKGKGQMMTYWVESGLRAAIPEDILAETDQDKADIAADEELVHSSVHVDFVDGS